MRSDYKKMLSHKLWSEMVTYTVLAIEQAFAVKLPSTISYFLSIKKGDL